MMKFLLLRLNPVTEPDQPEHSQIRSDIGLLRVDKRNATIQASQIRSVTKTFYQLPARLKLIDTYIHTDSATVYFEY